MKKWIITSVVLAAVLIGLSTLDRREAGMMALNSALKISREQVVTSDLSYGQQSWQKLDVHAAGPDVESAPVLVFIHGGGWYWGNKSLYYFTADAFTRLGYVVVLPDYVKYPQGRFPQFVEDGALALAWVKQHIHKYGGNPDALFLSGHSAGAHTGALLATDEKYLNAAGLKREDIKAFAGISGPYNFTPSWQQYVDTFGSENFTQMKASTHVDGGEPPMLLVHSTGDTQVGQFNQDTLAESLKGVGSDVDILLYDDSVNHINIMLKVHPWFAEDVNVAKDIDSWFRRFLVESE